MEKRTRGSNGMRTWKEDKKNSERDGKKRCKKGNLNRKKMKRRSIGRRERKGEESRRKK